MKRFLIALAVVIAAACVAAIFDFYDPAPVVTQTPTSEPIGAQHPKSVRP